MTLQLILDFLQKDTRTLNYPYILVPLPMLFCLLFILLRFAVLLGIQVRKQWFSNSSCGNWVSDLETFTYFLYSCLLSSWKIKEQIKYNKWKSKGIIDSEVNFGTTLCFISCKSHMCTCLLLALLSLARIRASIRDCCQFKQDKV